MIGLMIVAERYGEPSSAKLEGKGAQVNACFFSNRERSRFPSSSSAPFPFLFNLLPLHNTTPSSSVTMIAPRSLGFLFVASLVAAQASELELQVEQVRPQFPVVDPTKHLFLLQYLLGTGSILLPLSSC